jgi:predicted RNase H-like HicB family nuclease
VLDLKYSLIIEATQDPNFFGFFSPELEGFTGMGHSIEDCIYKARWGMQEHIELLIERNFPIPQESAEVTITIRNEEKLKKVS